MKVTCSPLLKLSLAMPPTGLPFLSTTVLVVETGFVLPPVGVDVVCLVALSDFFLSSLCNATKPTTITATTPTATAIFAPVDCIVLLSWIGGSGDPHDSPD